MGISLINKSASLPAGDVGKIAGALSAYVASVADDWDRRAPSIVLEQVGDVNLIFVDVLPGDDAPGDLGYHTLLPDDSRVAYVDVQACLRSGGVLTGDSAVSAVAAHEAAEWFVDPTCNFWADDYALEVADAFQGVPYVVGGIWLADYALPAAFDPRSRGPFDKAGATHAPFARTNGGYQITRGKDGQPARLGAEPPKWKLHTRSRLRGIRP